MPVKALEWCKAHYPNSFQLALSVVFGILIEIVILRFQPPLLMVRRAGDDTADQMIRLLERTTYSDPEVASLRLHRHRRCDLEELGLAAGDAAGPYRDPSRPRCAVEAARHRPRRRPRLFGRNRRESAQGFPRRLQTGMAAASARPLARRRSGRRPAASENHRLRWRDRTENGQRRTGPGQGQRDVHFAVVRARRRRQSAALEALCRGMQRRRADRRAIDASRRGDDRAASDLWSAAGR